MKSPRARTPVSKRLLDPIYGIDPEEIHRMRMQFLAELADWFLQHPTPPAGAHDHRTYAPATPETDKHAAGTEDSGSAGAESPSADDDAK